MHAQKATLFLFLSGVFIILAVYIGGATLKYMAKTTDYAEGNTPRGLKCTDYFFEVYDISYQGGTLKFTMKNQDFSQGAITVVTIESGQQRISSEQQIAQGMDKEIIFENVKRADNMTVYPNNCYMYAKNYKVPQ